MMSFSRPRRQGMDVGKGGVPADHENVGHEKIWGEGGIFEKRAADEGPQRGDFIENRWRSERGNDQRESVK